MSDADKKKRVRWELDPERDEYVVTVRVPHDEMMAQSPKSVGERRTLLELAVAQVMREAGVVL